MTLGDPDPAEGPRLRRAVTWLAWAALVAGAAGVAGAGAGVWDVVVPLAALVAAAAGLVASALPAAGFRRRATGIAAVVAVAAVAVAAIHSDAGLAVVLAGGTGIVLAGAVLRHARAERRRAERTMRGREVAGEPDDAPWGRCRAAARMVLPVLAGAALLVPVVTWRPRFVRATGDDAVDPDRLPGLPIPPDSGPGSTGGRDGAGPELVVDPAEGDIPDPTLRRRVLLEAEPRVAERPAGRLGAVYFRGLVLTDLDEAGNWHDDADVLPEGADTDDGSADGACCIGPRPPRDEIVEWRVRQDRLVHPATRRLLVHAPPGTFEYGFPRIAAEMGGMALAPAPTTARTSFRLRSRLPSRLPFPRDDTPAPVRDARAVAVPVAHPAVSFLAEAARAAAGAETSPLGRVDAVVAHLRSQFEYLPLDGDLSGLPALEAFVAERRGSCLEFAAAAAVMVRSLGIPARVATGFLATEFDTRTGRYVARGRDYHAWTEVRFAGCGWVVFDATPDAPETDRAALPPPDAWIEPAVPTEVGAAPGAGAAAEATGPRSALERLAAGVLAIEEQFAERPWLWSLVLLATVLLVARFLRRLAGRDAPDGPGAVVAAARSPWGRLLAALARRGHVRQPWQTVIEFSADVAVREGAALAALPSLAERQQAERFGGRRLTEDDEREMDALRASI